MTTETTTTEPAAEPRCPICRGKFLGPHLDRVCCESGHVFEHVVTFGSPNSAKERAQLESFVDKVLYRSLTTVVEEVFRRGRDDFPWAGDDDLVELVRKFPTSQSMGENGECTAWDGIVSAAWADLLSRPRRDASRVTYYREDFSRDLDSEIPF